MLTVVPASGLFSFLRVVALFVVPLTLFAQYRASLQGTVIDPTGAPIPGAEVVLTNNATGQERRTNSTAAGFYSFDRLAPGTYRLEVTSTGFKRQVLESITVAAEQTQGMNVTLEVGGVTETITVTGEMMPLLDTENASIDGQITQEEVLRLPQVGRDPYELARLAPGVFGSGARAGAGGSANFPNNAGPGGSGTSSSIFQTENQVQISANGQRVTANNYEIDGVAVNSQAWGGAAVVTPNQESVKEVRVVANSYSAETGRNSGALVQVVSQTGSNEFHGSVVAKINDPALNAFNRWGGPFDATPQKVLADQKQYAGSIGGRIIPDRLFFFFSYETLRNNTTNIETNWIETPEFRTLIGQARPNSIANTIVNFPGMDFTLQRVLDRTCESVSVAAAQCQAVPGGLDIGSPGGVLGQVAAGSVGGGLDGIPDVRWAETMRPTDNTAQQFNGRIDAQVTMMDLLAFSLYYTPNDTKTLSDGRLAQEFTSERRNTAASILYTRTLSPTMINEARFNVTRWFFNEIESNPDLPWGIPRINIGDAPFSTGLNWGVGGAGVFYQTTYNFRDILTKVFSTHSLKFGVDINREQNNDTVAWAARPTYQFDNLWSFANDAPTDESGFFDPRNGFPTDLKKYVRSGIYSLFIQDDWKVRPNLTLNLGLRWEYFTPIREKYDNISNIILGEGNNALTDARIVTGGNLWEPDRNNFAPQFGFAWNPQALNRRLVVRGGFGVGFNRVPMSLTLDGRLNPPFFGEFNLSGDDVLYSLGNDLTSFYGWPSNPATILQFNDRNIPITGAPVNVFGVPDDMKTPYSMRYSFDLQYELGGNWVASVGYQGSGGRKFPRRVNYSLFFEPNERLSAVRFIRNDVSSNFNALLTRISHRFSNGFDLQAQYRWSKSIDTCSNDNNCPHTFPFDLSQERGPSDFDVTHYFVLSGLWDIPVFRDQSNWTGRILGGWQLNGIFTAHSGFPWTPIFRDPDCGVREGRGGLCPLRPVAYLGGAGTDYGDETFKSANGNFPGGGLNYFVPPTGTGTDPQYRPPPPGIGRNAFRGPRYSSLDLSASKRFRLPALPFLGENASFDLRANAFNVFNWLNFEPFGFGSDQTLITNGGFGQPARGLAGRLVEFQARFSF